MNKIIRKYQRQIKNYNQLISQQENRRQRHKYLASETICDAEICKLHALKEQCEEFIEDIKTLKQRN